jgi:hypothetical protein
MQKTLENKGLRTEISELERERKKLKTLRSNIIWFVTQNIVHGKHLPVNKDPIPPIYWVGLNRQTGFSLNNFNGSEESSDTRDIQQKQKPRTRKVIR